MKKDWFKVSFYIELPEEEIKNMDIYSHLDFLPDCKKYKYDNICIWRAKEYSKEERERFKKWKRRNLTVSEWKEIYNDGFPLDYKSKNKE